MLKSTMIMLAAGTLLGAPALAQTTTGTSATGDNVAVGTYGGGAKTDSGAGVVGGGDAYANGGTATTNSTARANERQAMQRSVATAQSGKERGRSRTMTHVLPNGKVATQSMSMTHTPGEKPVIDKQHTVTQSQ